MKPEDYKRAAIRTENTPNFILKHRALVDVHGRITDVALHNDARHAADLQLSRIMHAILGMITELGELCDPVKRHLIYNAELDVRSNEKGSVREEIGDGSWYQALFLDAIDAKLEDIWERNIAKLRARFPDKFTNEAAINRDLNAEQRALEGPEAQLKHWPPTGAPSLLGLTKGGEAATRMMEEILCLKPSTDRNAAAVIFTWRRVCEFVGGEQVFRDNDPKHILSAMTDVAHRLGIDRPTKIVDGSNARLAKLCCDEIDRLKRENFELQERLAKIQVGLQTLSMG